MSGNIIDTTTDPTAALMRRIQGLEERINSLESTRSGIPYIWFPDSIAEGAWYATNAREGTVAVTKAAGAGNPLRLVAYASADESKKAGWWSVALTSP